MAENNQNMRFHQTPCYSAGTEPRRTWLVEALSWRLC